MVALSSVVSMVWDLIAVWCERKGGAEGSEKEVAGQYDEGLDK